MLEREAAPAGAGADPFAFHELRHTTVVLMISEGAKALQVKRRMGHEDVRTNFNIYGHLFDDEDALVERLDRWARGASVPRCWGFVGCGEAELIDLQSTTL